MPTGFLSGQQANDRSFRRGAIMGLTIAESFILLVFCLLLLFAFWQLQSERELTAVKSQELDPHLAARVVELERNGTLAALGELKAAGLDIRDLAGFAEAEDYWRFISKPELRRLMQGAVKLDAPQITSLADAVEAPPVLAQLGKLQSEVPRETMDSFLALSEDKRNLFLDAAENGQLATFDAIKATGLTSDNPQFDKALKAAAEFSDDPKMLDTALTLASLPADARDALDRLARSGTLDTPNAAGELAERLAAAEGTLKGISESLVATAEAQARLTTGLRNRLGKIVAGVNGQILDDGSIVLPEDVVFAQNQAVLKPNLRDFLQQACPPWLDLMRESGLDIAAAEIQGHASREWRKGTPEDLAYRNNLELSQLRARNVLNYCLDQVKTPETATWARGHVVAVGYSSSRPVTVDGEIDDALSRRVVFSIKLNREQLLDKLKQESSRTLSAGLAAGQVVQGKARIIDGDTLAIDGIHVRLSGIDAPELKQVCKASDGIAFSCGQASKEALERFTESNDVRCIHENVDFFGRSVAACFVGQTDLAKAMVDAGMAMAFTKFSDKYSPAEKAAQEHRVGLWSGEFKAPWETR